jgi:hypothetical protein
MMKDYLKQAGEKMNQFKDNVASKSFKKTEA